MQRPDFSRFRDIPSVIDLALDIVGVSTPLFGRILWGWNTRYFFILFLVETALLALFENAKAVRAELPPRPKPDGAPRTRADVLGNDNLVWFLLLIIGVATTMITLIPAVDKKAALNPEFALPPFDPVVYVLPFALIALGHVRDYLRFLSTKEYRRVSVDDTPRWAGLRVFLYGFFFMIPCVLMFGPWFSISILPIVLFILLRVAWNVFEFAMMKPSGAERVAEPAPLAGANG